MLLGENRLKQIFLKLILMYLFFFWLHCVFVAAYRLSLVAVYGIFIALASLVSEHQL